MVLHVMKWDIHPDKTEEYLKWVESAGKRILASPGLVEYRAYRPVTGTSQVVGTYEFADMAALANWQSSEDMIKLKEEFRTLAINISVEVWGPSPVVPEPLRP